MKESSIELKMSSDNMKILSSHVNEAGNKLSGAIKSAVDSTADLAQQNQLSAQKMESLRENLMDDVSQFSQLTSQLNGLIENTANTFGDLKATQKEFIGDLKTEVDDLGQKMTNMLNEYSSQANGQTAEHLKIWSQSVSDYSTQMNRAINSLSSVVDEMQAKLG
jgi:ABC-type transporter Mla subunit MlaD